jgi:hypothetical protein
LRRNIMNRRNFLGLAPIGVVAVAALVKGEDASTEVKKAKSITITGPNGEKYHPLVVEQDEQQYATVEPHIGHLARDVREVLPEIQYVERARLTSSGYFI